MAQITILGIDPGLGKTGITLLSAVGSSFNVQKIKCITPKTSDLWEKINHVTSNLKVEFPHSYTYLAIEEPIYSWGRKNPKAFAKSNILVGTLLSHFEDSIKKAYLLNPTTVKRIFAGGGKADKDDMVERAIGYSVHLRNVGNRKSREAIADSLGIAYTLWFYLRNPGSKLNGITKVWGSQ